MLHRIPRQIFFVNLYGYFVVAGGMIGAMLILLHSDRLGGFDVLLVAGIVVGLVGFWWRFHPRFKQPPPFDRATLFQEVQRGGQYALLAFESEYCPLCMTIGDRVTQLEDVPNLRVYRLSVNKSPGAELFRDFDLRMTPTYVLLSPQGEVIDTSPVVLPIEHILSSVEQAFPAA